MYNPYHRMGLKAYALEVKVKGEWVRFYAGNFYLTAEQAAWGNSSCKVDYRFKLVE